MTLATIDLLTFEALQANAGADFVLSLIEAFAEDAPQLLALLRTTAAQGDVAGFEDAAHALKSNGVAFGAVRFAELALRLEWQGPTAERDAVDALALEFDAVLQALRALAKA